MKILLTGATGFIGKSLHDFLNAQGAQVIPVARHARQDSGVSNLVVCDLAKELPLKEPVDAIIHAAAQSPHPGITTTHYIRSNIDALRRLIYYAKEYKVSRFIFFSSISLYGEVSVPVIDENSPIVNPDTYGLTKKLGELLLCDETAWLSCVSLRLPGVVGKGASTPWVVKIAQALKSNQEIEIYNPTALFNNMVYIDDLNAFVWKLLHQEFTGFNPLTLACRDPLSVRHSVDVIRDQFHATAGIKETYTEKMSFTISNRRAFDFGYKPKRAVEILELFNGLF